MSLLFYIVASLAHLIHPTVKGSILLLNLIDSLSLEKTLGVYFIAFIIVYFFNVTADALIGF